VSGDGPALFALSGAGALGERVAAALGEPLRPHEERDFEDGEHKSRPLGSVRGRDVFVLQGLRGGDGQSVNDRLCRLLFFCGALRDASAASITVVAPYLCYSRKDRRTKPRDPVTTRYVAQVLEAVAVERVVTLDVHNPAAFENAFRCRTEHLEARPLLVAHLAGALAGEPVTVVAPDAGGAKRADALRVSLSEALGARVASAYAEKERSGGVVTGDLLVGDLDGRVAVIVDDLIATGTTIVRTARRCLEMGARRVLAAVTHGVFARAADEALADPALAGLIVTDSADPRELTTAAAAAKLTVLPIAPFLAAAIRRLHEGGSLVDLHESWTGAQPMARARSRASNA
jgi:ribose-phosphate pyrophosphokinase